MKHLHALIVPTVAALFAAAVFAQDAPKPADLPDAPQATAAALVQPNGPTVVMDTSMGRITCQFYQKQAPNAVANFIGLAEGTKDWTDPVTSRKQHHKRLYDGTIFHRVIPEFMIQGGDPAGTGLGDPGFAFDDEFDPNLNFDVPGRLAMANSGPNTNGSQFFITEQAYDSLNQHYTIFGQCDEPSVEVVKAIARVQRDSNDRPLVSVILKKSPSFPKASHFRPTRPPRRRRPRHPNHSSNRPHFLPGALMALAPGTYAVFNTTEGKITVRLFESDAPITVKNFIELAEGTKRVDAPHHARQIDRQALRRHHLPSRDSRLHDPGRRPHRHRHGRPRLSL